MKIKKFKFKQILKLHLLNSRAYEYALKKVNSGFPTDLVLTQVISDFKKGLHLIFQYHQAEKQILFIGVPEKLEGKINKLTNHVALPSNFNCQGLISNREFFQKSLDLNKPSSSLKHLNTLLPKLVRKPDLVVLFSHEKKQNIILESCIAKVPLITFSHDEFSHKATLNGFYNLKALNSSFTEASNKNLFFLGLNFLFKLPSKRKSQSSSGSNSLSLQKKFFV